MGSFETDDSHSLFCVEFQNAPLVVNLIDLICMVIVAGRHGDLLPSCPAHTLLFPLIIAPVSSISVSHFHSKYNTSRAQDAFVFVSSVLSHSHHVYNEVSSIIVTIVVPDYRPSDHQLLQNEWYSISQGFIWMKEDVTFYFKL